MSAKKVCIVGASGKLGTALVAQCLQRGFSVVAVCREESVPKLSRFADQITIIPGRTNNAEIIRKAVAGCDGVLTVLVPMGFDQNSYGTAQAILEHAEPRARLIFSCGAHITMDGKDIYPWYFNAMVAVFGFLGWFLRVGDIEDQVRACRLIFDSPDKRWTVVRADGLHDGPAQGLPVWSQHYGDPLIASGTVCREDYAHFMVAALDNDALVKEAPAIVGCQTPSAVEHAAAARST